jgi:formylglycine-generating enzyme required for sulfatase activity
VGLTTALLLAAVTLPGEAAPVPATPAPSVEPAAHRGYRERLRGSKVTYDLVAIPGGTFLHGSPAAEKGRQSTEGPAHPVRVRPFWMGKTEVTWDLYDLYRKGHVTSPQEKKEAQALGVDAITRPSEPYPDEYRDFGKEGYPAIGMSHHAAMEFCRWLSWKTGKAYRLPTEAEWEWACRAGTTTAWFFGDRPERLGDYAWFADNAKEKTHPAGRKKPNPWGLHDVYGNVAEWCLDGYRRDGYQGYRPRKLSLSPVVLPGPERFPHVVRGGSWADEPRDCRSASRRGSDASWNRLDPMKPKSLWWLWNADFVGFRVVRAVEEQKELKGLRSRVTRQSK